MRAAVPEGCDYLFHLASNTKVRKHACHEQNLTNIRGVENVVSVCREKAVGRLIHTSSISVYFPSTHEYESYFPPRKRVVVLTEDTPRSPDDFWVNYCRTKCIQEKIVQASKIDHVIVQPSDIIGQYDTRSWGRLVRMIADARLVGVPDTKLNFVNVADVAEGQLKAALVGRAGATYILGGTPFRTAELMDEILLNIGRITGRRAEAPYMVPLSFLTALGCVQEWFDADPMAEASNTPEADESFPPETIFLLSSQHTTSSAKATRELGYEPTDRAGVVRAIRSMSDFALGHHHSIAHPEDPTSPPACPPRPSNA
eukprot:TRINITY_DN20322_c0_g1_i1.p1 TRINITY_DN20322_c0_g1~~TRINITY_DN20322_c0_g1_i1.p1  ORF type:complete len:314 (+),score=75.51 TRINITY_DN20322_c0_g1_i1:265-1206(+)